MGRWLKWAEHRMLVKQAKISLLVRLAKLGRVWVLANRDRYECWLRWSEYRVLAKKKINKKWVGHHYWSDWLNWADHRVLAKITDTTYLYRVLAKMRPIPVLLRLAELGRVRLLSKLGQVWNVGYSGPRTQCWLDIRKRCLSNQAELENCRNWPSMERC